jgi:hypothetical protein
MPELTSILIAKREKEYDEKKFLAAMQGVDLDGNSKTSDGKERGQKEWEDLKARVFSGGATKNSNDVLSLQGSTAAKAGIGIGMGLEYSSVSDKVGPKNPLG